MKVRIKQVPNIEPDANGEWIEVEIEQMPIGRFHDKFNFLDSLCAQDHHAVDYDLIK